MGLRFGTQRELRENGSGLADFTEESQVLGRIRIIQTASQYCGCVPLGSQSATVRVGVDAGGPMPLTTVMPRDASSLASLNAESLPYEVKDLDPTIATVESEQTSIAPRT